MSEEQEPPAKPWEGGQAQQDMEAAEAQQDIPPPPQPPPPQPPVPQPPPPPPPPRAEPPSQPGNYAPVQTYRPPPARPRPYPGAITAEEPGNQGDTTLAGQATQSYRPPSPGRGAPGPAPAAFQPPQQGYPPPQRAYPPPQQAYQAPQQGYPPPQSAYHPQQGYQQQGYPPPQQPYGGYRPHPGFSPYQGYAPGSTPPGPPTSPGYGYGYGSPQGPGYSYGYGTPWPVVGPPTPQKKGSTLLAVLVALGVAVLAGVLIVALVPGSHADITIGSGGQAPQLGSFAGYIQTSGVSQISASWKVPTVSSTSPDGSASTWIGVQGNANDEFYQIGVTENIYGGSPSYEAFWSDPARQFHAQFIMSVNAGDSISADIHQDGLNWVATITDYTTGATKAAPTSTGVFSGLDLAEWIQEDPSLPHNKHVPYPEIGSVTVSQMRVNNGPPAGDEVMEQVMTLPGGARVSPGPIVDDSFTTTQR